MTGAQRDHVIEVVSERRTGGIYVHKWACSCGKVSRRWYTGEGLAETAGHSHYTHPAKVVHQITTEDEAACGATGKSLRLGHAAEVTCTECKRGTANAVGGWQATSGY